MSENGAAVATEEINREKWLLLLGRKLTPMIEKAAGSEMPKFRISMGFPSRNALSLKRRRIGECWNGSATRDGVAEVMISPVIDQTEGPYMLINVVAHELIHVIDRNKNGHKGPFTAIARKIGLAGKPTATVPGPVFIERIQEDVLPGLPPMPIIEMNAFTAGRKVQPTRLIKCECATCGYIVRTTLKWLDVGAPHCPIHGRMETYG